MTFNEMWRSGGESDGGACSPNFDHEMTPDPLDGFPSEETDGPPLGEDFVPADAFDELALDHELTLDKLEDAKTQVDVLEEVNAELRDELDWLYDRYDALMNLVVIANR